MTPPSQPWYAVNNVADLPSPALLVYLDRIRENLRHTVEMAGGVDRLRPHVKTHKMAEIIHLSLERGITRFKCATIAEAEMTAQTGGRDILLAHQPVGPNIRRLMDLIKRFPHSHFSTICDNPGSIQALSQAAVASHVQLDLLLDLDCGMNRTGIPPGDAAIGLYQQIHQSPGLLAGGLHAYDGHIHEPDPVRRAQLCDEAFVPVSAMARDLKDRGLPVPRIVAGGTPTFPIHAQRAGVECGPGTSVFWDWGYSEKFLDLPFAHSAVLLSRVISKPASNRLCLDLGHKAVASENPHPRVKFFDLPEAEAVGHSEEHLVLQTPRASQFAVGDCFYGIPRHICPTVALHSQVYVVQNHEAVGSWKVTARDRVLTI